MVAIAFALVLLLATPAAAVPVLDVTVAGRIFMGRPDTDVSGGFPTAVAPPPLLATIHEILGAPEASLGLR